MIGHAEIYLTRDSAYLGSILIGDPQRRRNGLGQQIVSYLLEYAFEILEQTQVQLNVFDWNMGAIRCYEKVGFRINPDKKAVRIVNGQTWIAVNMTIERKNWKCLQQASATSRPDHLQAAFACQKSGRTNIHEDEE